MAALGRSKHTAQQRIPPNLNSNLSGLESGSFDNFLFFISGSEKSSDFSIGFSTIASTVTVELEPASVSAISISFIEQPPK